ncbi:hypothetical protein CDD80_1413 [Ophiocordyceps camponoti-rufipedis]|uniref:DUF4604 domain-containing protein n=1 Tax=Ophiocordyceps camponoti-rufipedis TaxID=2004952 RepID=A0A2C5X8X1_9HYPO|nr:hypothetical protein CDD80_1413 [Ophiocordyceps camponoti-rufipedis]
MPPKTNNQLRYDDTPPPFLARLRAQAKAEGGSGPDPLAAGRRRAGQKRSASEEAEDAPVIVDEHGHALHLDLDLLNNDDDPAAASATSAATSTAAPPTLETHNSSAQAAPVVDPDETIIGVRRRKAARAVGHAHPDAPAINTLKPKKKAKKIKLSFDPEEG